MTSSRPCCSSCSSSTAFTLVEVLLAVLILGLFFSVAFTEQAQSVVLESRARLEVAAAAQVRCRMSEIELQLVKDGYPASDESDSGVCCEAFEDERFECSWTIEAIELPSVADLEQSMQQQATDQTLVATEEGQETSSFADQAQSFLSMTALKQILPLLQGFLRDAIRKVEVTIFWRYRNRTFDFAVTQYVTNTSQGTLGAVLKADLVQKLMTGGPQALFDLLYGGDGGTCQKPEDCPAGQTCVNGQCSGG